MKLKLIHLLLMMLFFPTEVVSVDNSSDWGYEGDEPLGPDHWRDVYEACGESKQSPIDLSSPIFDRSLERFQFNDFDKLPKSIRLINDGRTARVFARGLNMTISGGSLGSSYLLDHLHFHWGANDAVGSEHTIEGKSYAIEIHLVHWNSEKYSNITQASSETGGLAVIGLMVGVSDDSSTLNSALGDLTKSFNDIHYAGNETNTKPFAIGSLLPKNTRYYRYSGSLTTPPCSQTVTWSVVADAIYITHAQAEAFRKFHEGRDPNREIDHSNRPVQPKNNRTLYLSQSFNSSGSQRVSLYFKIVATFAVMTSVKIVTESSCS